jgi:hypothetical protein
MLLEYLSGVPGADADPMYFHDGSDSFPCLFETFACTELLFILSCRLIPLTISFVWFVSFATSIPSIYTSYLFEEEFSFGSVHVNANSPF